MDDALSGRGQTEPLAALAAIALVCTAITLYTGLYGTVFDSVGEERARFGHGRTGLGCDR